MQALYHTALMTHLGLGLLVDLNRECWICGRVQTYAGIVSAKVRKQEYSSSELCLGEILYIKNKSGMVRLVLTL